MSYPHCITPKHVRRGFGHSETCRSDANHVYMIWPMVSHMTAVLVCMCSICRLSFAALRSHRVVSLTRVMIRLRVSFRLRVRRRTWSSRRVDRESTGNRGGPQRVHSRCVGTRQQALLGVVSHTACLPSVARDDCDVCRRRLKSRLV